MVAPREQIKNSNHKEENNFWLPTDSIGEAKNEDAHQSIGTRGGGIPEKNRVGKIGIYWSPSLSCPPTVSGIKRLHGNGFKSGIFY
jgi:hypothetical protein